MRLAVAEAMEAEGWSVGVIDARFAVPLDAGLIRGRAAHVPLVVTLEESVLPGGFGSAILEAAVRGVPIRPASPRFAASDIPAGRFVDHGSVTDLRRVLRLDEAGIQDQIEATIRALGLAPSAARVAAGA